ncbi:50S ribosomal protein L28 [endosymbiont of Euscepes postfasciatus]|uniref:50S ribosomal protein L28 n=1 Tax=endosymbiont of Euscepes postfasciatus TaxID=650377 RepID=UPI000DC723A7|nr:50S ribosomal protein L28 [endosymbiont of Euscepes postfasciatus]BBA84583.1 50S ribosomal protein L28 [endosymbiont of Euscepes postfasciatus]
MFCLITKKKTTIGNNRSNSMKSTKRKFYPNIHNKKVWISSKLKFIKLKLSSKALRILAKNGIEKTLSKFKIKY